MVEVPCHTSQRSKSPPKAASATMNPVSMEPKYCPKRTYAGMEISLGDDEPGEAPIPGLPKVKKNEWSRRRRAKKNDTQSLIDQKNSNASNGPRAVPRSQKHGVETRRWGTETVAPSEASVRLSNATRHRQTFKSRLKIAIFLLDLCRGWVRASVHIAMIDQRKVIGRREERKNRLQFTFCKKCIRGVHDIIECLTS
jgi:hypothetical protein